MSLSHDLRRLADNVQSRMWIASPYVGTWGAVKRILGVRWLENDIRVRLLTDTSGNSRYLDRETLKHFRGNVRHILGLHAKVYIIDKCALVTSANLTETAFKKRVEIGVLLMGTEAEDVIHLYRNWWGKESTRVSASWVPADCDAGNYQEEPSGKGLPIRSRLPPAPRIPTAKSRNETRKGPGSISRSQDWVQLGVPVVSLLERILREGDRHHSLNFFLRRQKGYNFGIVGEKKAYSDSSPASDEQPLRLTFRKGPSVKLTALLKGYASNETRMKWHQRLSRLLKNS